MMRLLFGFAVLSLLVSVAACDSSTPTAVNTTGGSSGTTADMGGVGGTTSPGSAGQTGQAGGIAGMQTQPGRGGSTGGAQAGAGGAAGAGGQTNVGGQAGTVMAGRGGLSSGGSSGGSAGSAACNDLDLAPGVAREFGFGSDPFPLGGVTAPINELQGEWDLYYMSTGIDLGADPTGRESTGRLAVVIATESPLQGTLHVVELDASEEEARRAGYRFAGVDESNLEITMMRTCGAPIAFFEDFRGQIGFSDSSTLRFTRSATETTPWEHRDYRPRGAQN